MSNSSERPKPLGFDLRARIAAIQVGHYPWLCHYPWLYDRTLACTCGEYRSEPDLFRQWGDHVADVLIREMGLDAVISLARDWHNDYDATPAHDPRNPSEADIAYDDAGFQILHTLGFITDHGNCFNCGGADR